MSLPVRRLKRTLLALAIPVYFLVVPFVWITYGYTEQQLAEISYFTEHLKLCFFVSFPLVSGLIAWIELRQALYRRRSAKPLRERASAMMRLADELDFRYEPGLQPIDRTAWYPPGTTIPGDVQGAAFQGQYHVWRTFEGYPFNILTGIRSGCGIHLFDYHEFSSETREQVTAVWGDKKRVVESDPADISVATLELDRPLPLLIIHPEGVWDDVAERLGGIDVDLESFAFSESYRVWSKDRRFAFAFCHPRMMEYLMQFPDLSLRVEGETLALRHPEFTPPSQLAHSIDILVEVSKLIPRHASQ